MIIFLFLLILKPIAPCNVVISEFNYFSKIGASSFIELGHRNCKGDEKPVLDEYGLLMLRSKKNGGVEIILTVDFARRAFSGKNFFVISKSEQINEYKVDLQLTIKSALTGWIETIGIERFFGKGEENVAHLLLLIKINRKNVEELENWNKMRLAKMENKNLKREGKPINLNDEQLRFLQNKIIDAAIFAKEDRPILASAEFTLIFEIFLQNYNNMKMTKEYNKIDNSVNRCDDNDGHGFFSELFPKIGIITPGKINCCTGEFVEICESAEDICMPNLNMPLEEEEENVFEEDESNIMLCQSASADVISEESSMDFEISQQDERIDRLKRRLSVRGEINQGKKKRIDQGGDDEIDESGTVDDDIVEAEITALEKNEKPWEKNMLWDNELENAVKKLKWFNYMHTKKFYGKWLIPILRGEEVAFKCYYCRTVKEMRFLKEGIFKNKNQITPLDVDNFEKAITSSFAKAEGNLIEFVPNKDYEQFIKKGETEENAKRKTIWKKFRILLSEHAQSASHLMAMNYYKNNFKNQREMEIQRIKENAGITTETEIMFRLVYTEAKTNGALANHKKWIYTMEKIRVNVGVRHSEITSATRILEVISKEMHSRLIGYIQKTNSPVSIIVDASTDTNQNQYLVVLLRFVQKNYPITQFYRLLKIPSEKSELVYNEIVRAFHEDGLTIFMKKNLIGFGSDGANAMRGAQGGLFGRLKTFVENENQIYPVHCFAHRLNLALVKGLRTIGAVKFLEEYVQSIVSFFSHSAKRKSILSELAVARNRKLYELKSIFYVRWAESEFSALKSIVTNYDLLHEFFINLAADSTEFDNETRIRASAFTNSFSSVSFDILLSFILDCLNIINKHQKILQTKAGVIIGQNSRTRLLLDELISLKEENGPYLNKFKKEIVCITLAGKQEPCRDNYIFGEKKNEVVRMYKKVGEYQMDYRSQIDNTILPQSAIVIPRTETRRNQENAALNLSLRIPIFDNDLRKKIINSVVGEINSYFPVEMDFDILDPGNFPTGGSEIAAYARKIRELAKKFGIDELSAETEFGSILSEILQSCRAQAKKLLQPQRFWKFILDEFDVGIELKKILIRTLSIAIGSVDAERCFSVLFHIRTKRSSRLTAQHLEDRLRLRMNGPKVEKFDPFPYKRRWFKEGHMASSSEIGIRKKKDDAEEDLEQFEPILLEPFIMANELENYDGDGYPVTKDKNAFYKDPEREVIDEIYND